MAGTDRGEARVVALRPRPSGDAWDDPGRLIDTWMHSPHPPAHDPDTLIIAWLAALPRSVPPPKAARSLLRRLAPASCHSLSAAHRRLFDLLAHVASHTRVPNPANDPHRLESDPS
ncbi:hypothetical protein [Rhodospira trueperi]|uniref:Uncharacterized protein n=1 Tax=Rhodospira trueperi TaxID=69960 RepID=A0A1G7EZ21_9PROT|nr:hypothetical protein [Rhodospira trueperi]SDE68901.1 hypothetical protein SAMN05421720_11043 [Rhodospira trueperi]